MRWRGRRGNQQQQRREWVPPDLAHRPRPFSVMSHYSDPRYVIGNSTAEELERIARLFKSGNDSDPRSPAELPANSREYIPLAPRTRSIGSTVSSAPIQPQIAELESTVIAELPASFAFSHQRPSPTTWNASQSDESIKHYQGKGKKPETPTSSGETGEGGFF